MTLSTYAHLFDEAAGADRAPAEDQIRRARQLLRKERRTRSVPEEPIALRLWEDENPGKPGKPTRGLEPRTPSLRGSAGVGSGVHRREREGTKVLLAARTAADCSGRRQTAKAGPMFAESTRGVTTKAT